jgi:hypothetical protein
MNVTAVHIDLAELVFQHRWTLHKLANSSDPISVLARSPRFPSRTNDALSTSAGPVEC